ncbi:TPA: nucleoside phosphorylase [Streptococcus agalactiae]|nr:nucleoside phosphorylase [Streptococcus agalactiae]
MIINSFDNSRKATINPEDINSPIKGFPKTVITCFARETFNRILEELPHREIARTSVANLEIPIYELEFKGQKIGFFNAYVGASACVAILEDIIVFGMENLIVFGTCGVLDSSIEETSIIIPRSAIRDEGTSFHCSEASSEIAVNTKFHEEFKSFLDRQAVSYTEGKVWTTDGIYRETVDKMLEHKRNGAICVDMECSAIAALSKFRNINHFQFFYSADNLDAEVWEARSLGNSEDLEKKDKIAYIAMEFAIETF